MHRRIATSALSLVLASALVLAPMRTAFAGAGDDATVTVWTKDGGMYRGELVEREPGDHILIKLADGRTKRIEWKDVERDSIGTPTLPAPPVPTPVPAPTPSAAPAATPDPDGVTIQLRGDGTMRLIRETGYGSVVGSAGGRSFSGGVTLHEIVCYAPCNVVVPRGGGYRVMAEGRRTSAPFVLEGHSHTIDAKLGSIGGYTAGMVTTGIGAGALLGGLLVYAIESSGPGMTSYDYTTGVESTQEKSYTLSWAFIGIGAVVTIIGVIAWASNTNEVRIDDQVVGGTKRSSGFALTANGFVF